MPIAKTIAFIKQKNGNVTLLNFNTGDVTACFVGSQNLIKNTVNPNKFYISSISDTSRRGLSVDFREIDGTQCIPVVDTLNIDFLLVDLAKHFFFLDSSIAISQKVITYSDLLAGEVAGEIAYVEQSQGTQWLPGSLGGNYFSSGWYVWSGTSWIYDMNAIANAIKAIVLNQGELLQNIDGGIIF